MELAMCTFDILRVMRGFMKIIFSHVKINFLFLVFRGIKGWEQLSTRKEKQVFTMIVWYKIRKKAMMLNN